VRCGSALNPVRVLADAHDGGILLLAMSARRDVIEGALASFFAERTEMPVASAYLFGSEAEGRPHRESDVDVGVLLDRSRAGDAGARFDLRIRLGSELISVLHRNEVDVVVLDDAPPLLGRRIVTEGRRVFCRDAEADHAYRRDVQLRAADLAPFLERHRRRLLEEMRR
jgi:predicted nucleotidyltransferase